MKPSSLSLAFASALSLIALPHASQADVVVMKDGKKYESATVLSETADSVTFKYMLTPRIPDTRTEPKANIAQIIKQRPEEVAIVPLRKLMPSEDLLTADKYEGIIQDQLRPFVSQFPGTAEAKEVEAMITTYEAEKTKVTGGQLKMDGQWLTPEMVKRETRNIEAYRIRKTMNAAAAKSDWTAALNEWDKLNDRADGFVDTEQYVQTVPEAQKILESYKQQLERLLAEQPQLQLRRDSATKGLVEPDLSRTKKAIAEEVAKFKNINDLEKKMRTHWMTIYKYDAKGIQAAAKSVVDELAKMAALDLPRLKATNEAITAARRYLGDQNVELAEASVAKAIEAAGRSSIVSTAITKLKADITKVKGELGKKRATQRLYGNSSALTGATSETDDRVAKAMEDSAKDKADKKAAKEEDKDEPVAKATGGLTAGSKGASSPSTKSSATKSERSSSKEDAAESDSGLQKYLIIGGGALLAVLLAALFMQKKK